MTSVPSPLFGPQGFSAPAESDVLNGVRVDFNAAFGGNLNLALSTPQGQLATSLSAIIADKGSQFCFYASQVDPLYAQGRMQDAIARIYFLDRDPATSTTVTGTCTGLAGVLIPKNAQAIDTNRNIFLAVVGGTIPPSGTIDLAFAAQDTGPLACPAHALSRIYQTIPGWDSIDNATGVAIGDAACGRDAETQQQFEYRRQNSVAHNAQGTLPAIYGAVLSCYPESDPTNRVTDVYATDNNTGSNKVVGGVTLIPHSVYVCAADGDDASIANAIWTKKMPGCDYSSGNLFVGDVNTLTLSVYSVSSGFIDVGQTVFGLEVPTAASFTGTVDLETTSPLTASFVVSGPAITVDSVIRSASVTDLPLIEAQRSGVPGGTGVYELSTLEAVTPTELMESTPTLGVTASINGLTVSISTTDGVLVPYTCGDPFYPCLIATDLPDWEGSSKLYLSAQINGLTGDTGDYLLNVDGGTIGSEAMRVVIGLPTSFYGSTVLEYDNILTANTVTGKILPDQVLSGSGVPAAVTIVSQLTGKGTGGDGTYLLSPGVGTITTESMYTAGLTYPADVTIEALGSGSGAEGTYVLNQDISVTTASLSLSSGIVVKVPDTSYPTPYPLYDVIFSRPVDIPIYFTVILKDGPGIPSNYEALVKQAILDAWVGNDGGPSARIGGGIHSSRYYPPVQAISIYLHIVSILVGTTVSPSGTDITMDINQRPTLEVGHISVGTV